MKKNGWIVIIVTLIALLLPAAGIQIALHGKTVPLDRTAENGHGWYTERRSRKRGAD